MARTMQMQLRMGCRSRCTQRANKSVARSRHGTHTQHTEAPQQTAECAKARHANASAYVWGANAMVQGMQMQPRMGCRSDCAQHAQRYAAATARTDSTQRHLNQV